MAPSICTSKWRMPSTRFEASRQTGEGLVEDGIECIFHRLAGVDIGLDAVLEFSGLAAQFVVGQRLHLRLQRIDARHPAAVLFQESRVAAAEDAGQ